jgi:flagellar biogenesis protein FliO
MPAVCAMASGGLPATNVSVSAQQTNTNAAFLQEYYDQDEKTAARSKQYKPPNPIWTAIKVIFYTGLVAVAAYFLIKFVISKGSLPATADADFIEVLMNKQIGMGSYIQVVKVGATYYLLGLSGDGVRLIDKIGDKETIDFIELNKDNLKPKETRFFDILSYIPKAKNLSKFDFLKNQKDRLKKL